MPSGNVTFGVTPERVPNGPVHVYVSGSASGSLDADPFSVAVAPAGDAASST